MLKMHHVKRMEAMEQRLNKRGAESVAALGALMDAVEPMYVLDYIPNKALRHGYIDAVRNFRGPHHADHLTFRVHQLLRDRRANDVPLAGRNLRAAG